MSQKAGKGILIKRDINDLAILGGIPAFKNKLHVGRPNLGNRQRLLDRINDVLDRRWFTNKGIYVQELEQKIAKMIGVKHCIAVCNGTVGLEIAIRAAGLEGEVIIPSFTFIATAHSLQWLGITPVFCDIEPQTHNLDPCQVEKMITARTTGIIGVHMWGQPCNVDALKQIAHRHNIKLLFDAAHAFSCSYKGQKIGQFGDAEVFSFHATKFFNTFEGGAIVTNNDSMADNIRLMKNFGFRGYDNVCCIGTNGKMSEVSAAMGLTELESLDKYIADNYRNYKHYRGELAGVPGINLLSYNEDEQCNYQWIVLEIEEKVFNLSRDQLVKIFHAENILVRRYFYPGCHHMEPYRSFYPHTRLPNTEKLVLRVMSLPTGSTVGKEEIKQICSILDLITENAVEVKQRIENLN